MKSILKSFIVGVALAALVGCGTDYRNERTGNNPNPTPPSGDPWIVMSRSSTTVHVDAVLGLVTYTTTGNDSTQTVTNATMSPSASMTMSSASFSVPTLSSVSGVSFGSLNITALSDNNLKICGTGNQKCTSAALRVYTTGQAGAGFWNSVDSYGAPITAYVGTNTPGTVGLNSANATYVETVTIGSTKNVVTLSDFSPAPNINIVGDFSNAGAGTYSATINVEFVVGL